MTDLADLTDGLKREVAVPGDFATVFPNTADDDLVGSLADGFSEAQFDGFFPDMALDTDLFTVSPDLSAAGAALVVIYSGMRIIRAQLRALVTSSTYKAGNVEYQTARAASVLKAELDHMAARKQQIITTGGTATEIHVVDSYYTRQIAENYGVGDYSYYYGGFYAYELGRT